MSETVYDLSLALSTGKIQLVEIQPPDADERRFRRRRTLRTWREPGRRLSKHDWRPTAAEAVEAAERRREKTLAALRRKIARIEAVAFEVSEALPSRWAT